MTEISRAWTGNTGLGAAGDAGPYSADQWAQLWRLGSGNGAADGDSGPIMGSGTAPDPGLTVSATGPVSATVNVSIGAALVHGTFYLNDATKNLSIAANVSGNPRIDTVVLRKDWTAQTVRLAVLTGTPGVTPVASNLTQSDGVLWEVPLADIAVASGFVSISQSNITPRRHWANVSDGIYLNDILNNTAGILEAGDLVIRDTTANRAATTTTTAGDPLVMGVWVARTAAGAYGRVLQNGIGYVKSTAAVTRGQGLVISATAKSVDPIAVGTATTSNLRVIGFALETTSAGGLVLALIDVGRFQVRAEQSKVVDNGASYTTSSTSYVDVDATNMAVTLITTGKSVLVGFLAMYGAVVGAPLARFDLLVDGVRYANAGVDGLIKANDGAGGITSFEPSGTILVTGLTPGSHTFKLQWKVAANSAFLGAGNGVAGTDTIPVFWAIEVN